MSTEAFTRYAEEHGVKFDWSALGFKSDPDGWEHQLFKVTLTVADASGGSRESFDWRQGTGIDRDPDVGDVLEALIMDAHAGRQPFDEFCADYGYDTDSRRAYASWEACRRTGEQLVNLFGSVPDVRPDES